MADIEGPSPSLPPPSPDHLPTVKGQWIMIAVVSTLIMLCLGADLWSFPRETAQGQKTPLVFVAGILHMLGCEIGRAHV